MYINCLLLIIFDHFVFVAFQWWLIMQTLRRMLSLMTAWDTINDWIIWPWFQTCKYKNSVMINTTSKATYVTSSVPVYHMWVLSMFAPVSAACVLPKGGRARRVWCGRGSRTITSLSRNCEGKAIRTHCIVTERYIWYMYIFPFLCAPACIVYTYTSNQKYGQWKWLTRHTCLYGVGVLCWHTLNTSSNLVEQAVYSLLPAHLTPSNFIHTTNTIHTSHPAPRPLTPTRSHMVRTTGPAFMHGVAALCTLNISPHVSGYM